MIDVVKEATVVPLPLQFAMIAQRAGAAIQLLDQGETLGDRHQRALENAGKFLQQALRGKEILSGAMPGVYDPDAMSAFEVTEGVKGIAATPGQDFREKFQQQLVKLVQQHAKGTNLDLTGLREFFRKLGEWCLAQNVAELERVQIDVPGS